MFLQLAPFASQPCHWYWKEIGAEPFQVPGFAVSVSPTDVEPLIVGGVEFVGATLCVDLAARATPVATSAATPTAIASASTRAGGRSDGSMRIISWNLL